MEYLKKKDTEGVRKVMEKKRICFKIENFKSIEWYALFAIVLLFSILNLNTLSTWFRSDSEAYYLGIRQSVQNIRDGQISLANFKIAGHSCYGYSIFVFLGELLIPYRGIGIRLMNLILSIITIIMEFMILKKIFPEMDKIVRILLTAVFAFSPFLFGIFSEVGTDFAVLCFFTWLVFSYIYDKKALCFFSGILLCLSKEIGILYYCSFFGACYIYRLFKNSEKNFLKKIYDEFLWYEWFYLLPVALFFFFIGITKGTSSWVSRPMTGKTSKAAAHVFRLDWYYVWVKIKEIFMMNFSWLLIIPLLLLIAAVLKRNVKRININKEWFCGICVSLITFLMFNLLYVTYTHYRYMQLYLFFFVFFVAFLFEVSGSKIRIKRGISAVLAVLLFVESYVVIDPVTYLMFRTIDVGNGKIITTKEYEGNADGEFANKYSGADLEIHQFADSIVYNKECLGIEKVFEKALADINYSNRKAIIFPAIYGSNIYNTIFNYMGIHNLENIHWDNETNDITYDADADVVNFLDISKEVPANITEYDEVWYVKLPYKGEWYEEKNYEKFEILEKRTYQSGKWKIALEKVRIK